MGIKIMKIVHVLANNLNIWQNAVAGTDCLINGYIDIDELIESLPQYNIRDVIGFIFFPNSLTQSFFNKIYLFDNFFIYSRTVIVLIGDNSDNFIEQQDIKFKHIDLYSLNSENGSISDTDINNIFTLLLASYGDVYKIPKPMQDTKSTLENMINTDSNATYALKIALGDDFCGFRNKE